LHPQDGACKAIPNVLARLFGPIVLESPVMTATDSLEDHLRDPVDDAVRAAYVALATARLPEGLTVRLTSQGFTARELRFERQGIWLYAAVLHPSWILWYFRRPAFREGLIEIDATKARFPDHKDGGTGEIKLRITDTAQASAVLTWIGAEG
jgi:hypothetical protein